MPGQHLSTGEIVTDKMLDTYGRARKLRSEMFQAGRELRHMLPEFHAHGGRFMLNAFMSAEQTTAEEVARAKELTREAYEKWVNAELLEVAHERQLPGHLAKIDRELSALLRNKIIDVQPVAGVSVDEAIRIKRQDPAVGSLHVPEEGVRGVFKGVSSGEGQLFLGHPERGSTWEIQVVGERQRSIQALANLAVVPVMSPGLPRLSAT